MTYRSPFRDVADAFSNVAPNVAQGVANQAERKRQEDSWARAAAQKQTQDLEARLGELRAQPPDEANKAETDQQIAMISRAMEMYQGVYTAQPGKAYDAWMAVSSGALSVPVIGPQAAASPRERAAGRPTTTGETMSVPELMGRSAGTVSRNLLNAEQRKIVQTSNSELVREAFQFLMNPNSIDFSNPLAEEQAAMILSSIDSFMSMDVLPGMEDMRDRLPELARGLRAAIMESGSQRLRALATEKVESAVEAANLANRQAQTNLDASNVELSYIARTRESQLGIAAAQLANMDQELIGMKFSNGAEQYQFFMQTGYSGSPQERTALMTRMGLNPNDPAQVAAFDRTAQNNNNRFVRALERESERLDVELGIARSNLNLNDLRAQELVQQLERGTFELTRDQWMQARNERLARITDSTDALSYAMQATTQGDASALSFILREMQDPSSEMGAQFRQVMTTEDVERRYRYALTSEEGRAKDQERRELLTNLEFENAMRRSSDDAIAAGIEVGAWAAQSMNEQELASWHAEQIRSGRTLPSLENLQMQRAVHVLNLQSPIKQELWEQIQQLSSMPVNPDTIGTAIAGIESLLTDSALGLSPDIVDAYLNGFAEAQARDWQGFNLNLLSANLKNDLLEADIAARYAEVESRLAQAASASNPTVATDGVFADLIQDQQDLLDAVEANRNNVRALIEEASARAQDLKCNAPVETRTTDGMAFQGGDLVLDSTQTTSFQPADPDECANLNDQILALNAELRIASDNANATLQNLDQLIRARAMLSIGVDIPAIQDQRPQGNESVVPPPPSVTSTFEYRDNPRPAGGTAAPAPAATPVVPAAPTSTPAATPAAATPAATPRQQGPMLNPNPNNLPAPTLSPEINPTNVIPQGTNVPQPRNPAIQRVSDLAQSLTGASEGPNFTMANGALTSFVFNGWHPSYRNANRTQYTTPQAMAQAILAMPDGPDKNRLADQLHSYLATYVQPSIVTDTTASRGSTRIASEILTNLGVRR